MQIYRLMMTYITPEGYFDDASSIKYAQPPNLPKARANIDLIFITPEGGIIRCSYDLIEPHIKNEAEYETLVAGLEEAVIIRV